MEQSYGTEAQARAKSLIQAGLRTLRGGWAIKVKRWASRNPGGAALLVMFAAWVVFVLWPKPQNYPKVWDSRITKLAARTEVLRGLRYKHPVTVSFMTDDEFDREDRLGQDTGEVWQTRSSYSEPENLRCFRDPIGLKHPRCSWGFLETGKEIDPIASTLRALGLSKPTDTISGLPLSIEGSFAVARYDPKRGVVEIRGKTLLGRESILIHELTHVLQHQHFGFRNRKIADEILGYRSLLEGDATRVENLFVKQEVLSPKEYEARNSVNKEDYERSVDRINTEIDSAGLSGQVAGSRIRRGEFPYTEGETFVSAVFSKGGQTALDKVYKDPPKSSAEIMNPTAYFAKSIRNPKRPHLKDSQYAYNTKEMRLGVWYVSEALWAAGLGARAPAVISSWSGDSLSIYEDNTQHKICFTTVINPTGKHRVQAAGTLHELADLLSGRFLTRPDKSAEFSACDPAARPDSHYDLLTELGRDSGALTSPTLTVPSGTASKTIPPLSTPTITEGPNTTKKPFFEGVCLVNNLVRPPEYCDS